MLVLTRKARQGIALDCNGVAIRVVIVRVRGGDVSIGVEAPPDVVIRREELPPRPRATRAGGPA